MSESAEKWLPSRFRNCIVAYEKVGGNDFVARVRSSASTKEDLTLWRQEFESKTNTHWTVRHTFPGVQRLAFRNDFVCQHSSFNKSKSVKRATKNCDCTASLVLKIKKLSRRTKQTDPYMKVKRPQGFLFHCFLFH